MKAIMMISAGCVMLGLAFLLFHRSSGDKISPTEEVSSETPARAPGSQAASGRPEKAAQPTTADEARITKEEFEQLPRQEQDKAIKEFIAAFWEHESAGSQAATAEESKYLPLDLFGRPYMRTLGESDLLKLSPEDREKAMAETMDSCRQIRNQVFNVVAQAKAGIENGDHARGEAYLISALETGRDINANRDGLIITRRVGFSCQKVALNEMVGLYTKTGEQAKLQVAQQQLRDIDAEVNELRNAAQTSN